MHPPAGRCGHRPLQSAWLKNEIRSNPMKYSPIKRARSVPLFKCTQNQCFWPWAVVGSYPLAYFLPALHPVWGGWPLPRLGHDRLCRGLLLAVEAAARARRRTAARRRHFGPRAGWHCRSRWRCQDTLLPRSCAGAGGGICWPSGACWPAAACWPRAHRGVGPAGCPWPVLHPAVWQLFFARAGTVFLPCAGYVRRTGAKSGWRRWVRWC